MDISSNNRWLIPFLFLFSFIFLFISQEAFMENYFSSQIDHIFRNVSVLIYVFDIESRELQVSYLIYINATLMEYIVDIYLLSTYSINKCQLLL